MKNTTTGRKMAAGMFSRLFSPWAAIWLSMALLGILVAPLAPRVWASARQQKNSGGIHVDVNLVEIFASVVDANNQPVVDLKPDAFDLAEEGVPQKIVRFEADTNRPLDLALMIDSSMSTTVDLKFEDEAAAHFIRQVVRPNDTLSVFEFSDAVTQLGEFSDDVAKLQASARRITPGAGTAMYDAIALGSQALRRRPAGRRRAIVLLTDAGETTSTDSFDQARRNAVAASTLLYSIVVRPVKSESGRNTAGEHALITMTDATGGALYFLDSFAQLEAMFDRIDRELRTQYLIGYYPSPSPSPGALRHLTLKVNVAGTVHYRQEYFAPSALR
ncbi:MAG: VWA domain-containing protein [Candidatus Acidiferrales bacterium]